MVNNLPLSVPAPIDNTHDTSAFDCGVPALNNYLKKYAIQNHHSGSAKTYVATRGSQVVGYYTLAFGSVTHAETPERVKKGLGQYSIPIILLARLAVNLAETGKGMGKGLLKDALLRTIPASDIAGLRAVLVHAKDDDAKNFYEKFGFVPSPIDKFHLYLLLKDIKKILTSLSLRKPE
ncbi:MAG: GNAT family N-acetyltransferase [SAR324 cluster bacterium]|nr:GNAT family N-acetyltransferase [SAR324 cluster bacterium]